MKSFTSHKGNYRTYHDRTYHDRTYHVPGSVDGKAPTRQLHSAPIAVSGSGHTGNLINALKLPSICKYASQAVLSTMQLTLHATRRTTHGASRLVQAMSAWSVKTSRAPSRHCSDARVIPL